MKAYKDNNGSAVELNENELSDVNGGFNDYEVTEIRYDISEGDTFKAGNEYCVFFDSATRLSPDTHVYYRRYFYLDVLGKYRDEGLAHCNLGVLLSTRTFVGNNIIGENDIYKEEHGTRIR